MPTHKIMRFLLIPATAFVLLATTAWATGAGVPTPAAASAADPAAVIQRVSSHVLNALNANKDKFKSNPELANEIVHKYLLPDFDFDLTSQLVLGRYWRTATPAQRKAFQVGFLHYLTNTYAEGLRHYNGAKIEVMPFRGDASEKYVKVRSRIVIPDHAPVEVDYAMVKAGASWKVFDVIIAGVSYVRTYQSEFQGEIARTGLDALIRRLQTATAPAIPTAVKAAVAATGK